MADDFDRRIDRLADRHEALTQSVELLLKTSQEHSRQIEALITLVRSHEERLDRLEGQ